MNYSDCLSLLQSTEEIEFSKEGTSLQPSEVFENMYTGLDTLLDYNNTPKQGISKDEQNRLYHDWKDNISNGITATVSFFDGSVKDLKVRARTNFKDLTRGRRPSMIYLEDKLGTTFVLRNGKAYEANETDFFSLNRNLDKKWYHLLRDEHKLTEPEPHKNLFFPEAYLVPSLETIYAEGAPRITPRMRVLEVGEHNIYYLRPFLNLVTDLSFDDDMKELFGNFLGIMKAYRLIEGFDRQVEHYALSFNEEGNIKIVNYDPDLYKFITSRTKRDFPFENDWGQFRDVMKSDFPSHISPKDFKEIKSIMRETESKKELREYGEFLLASLKPSLDQFEVIGNLYVGKE